MYLISHVLSVLLPGVFTCIIDKGGLLPLSNWNGLKDPSGILL